MVLVPDPSQMNRARPAGFSLVELMIVVGLISVLGAMTGPVIQAGMAQYALISATQQVASTIRTARFQSVAKNRTLRVRFNNPAADQYRVLDDVDAAVGEVQILPSGAQFGAISGDLEIDPEGRITPLAGAAPATIVVSNGDAAQDRTITVAASGRVQTP